VTKHRETGNTLQNVRHITWRHISGTRPQDGQSTSHIEAAQCVVVWVPGPDGGVVRVQWNEVIVWGALAGRQQHISSCTRTLVPYKGYSQ
jgi:hypothetical protein